jgi:Putative prokaryotic signal transducing protein
MHPVSKLVTVYTALGRMEAEIVRGRLEAEQIPSMLAYESVGQVFGLTMDGLGQVQVMVPEQYAELARKVVGEPPADDSDPQGSQA